MAKIPPFFQEKFFAFDRVPVFFKPWFISSLASIAGLGVLTIYWNSERGGAHYQEMQSTLADLKASVDDPALFQKVKKLMHKSSSLEKRMAPEVLQLLVANGKLGDAEELSSKALKEAKEIIPFHVFFSETSSLIERMHYQEALEKSVSLRERMLKAPKEEKLGTSVIFAYNLLRIACLQQTLQNKPGEKAAWEDLEGFFQEQKETSSKLLEIFQERGVDLFQYISLRKKAL